MSKNASNDPSDYSEHYDESTFWEKAAKVIFKAGKGTIEKALTLYYCLQDRDTPSWAKATIIGALGYFIFPVDAIPDVIPVVGFVDDAAVIGAAFITVAIHIKPEHTRKAKEQINIWLNSEDE